MAKTLNERLALIADFEAKVNAGELNPKFKVGDHISHYGKYNVRRTGVITMFCGTMKNIDGPVTINFVYKYKDDITGYEQISSEKDMKFCKTK